MDSVLLMPGEEVRDLVESLKNAILTMQSTTKKSEKEFVCNEEFMHLMGISKRTAQSWRDEGIISFSQIGGKIYYKLEDINNLLRKHRHESYSNKK